MWSDYPEDQQDAKTHGKHDAAIRYSLTSTCTAEKYQVASSLKGIGNDYFKNKDYAKATVKYRKVSAKGRR